MILLSRRRLLATLPAGLAALTPLARAQAYPSRQLKMIVGTPPGGPTDISGRVMQPVMQRLLGQTIIVENVLGASGSIGIQRMLNAPPDGHTLYLATPSDAVLAPLGVPRRVTRPRT